LSNLLMYCMLIFNNSMSGFMYTELYCLLNCILNWSELYCLLYCILHCRLNCIVYFIPANCKFKFKPLKKNLKLWVRPMLRRGKIWWQWEPSRKMTGSFFFFIRCVGVVCLGPLGCECFLLYKALMVLKSYLSMVLSEPY